MTQKPSELFKAVGDPMRLEILRMLTGKELCVCDIMNALPVSQPTISHHLKVLKYAGLVSDRKDGKWVYYRLNAEAVKSLVRILQELDDGGAVTACRKCGEEE
jgi:ArsR family transcriptional regulator